MPSDTFGEVVRWLDAEAAKHENDPFPDEYLKFDRAARLLEAAGRECRAGRRRMNKGGLSLDCGRSAMRNYVAALDALAPELSAALTPPTKEAP